MDRKLALLVLLLVAVGLCSATQRGEQAILTQTISAVTPGFVSEASNNSLLTSALGAKANNTCITDSVCENYADVALAGNLGITCWQASSSPTPTFTTVDDKSDSYTVLTKSSADSSKVIDCAYAPNLTAGARAVTIGTGAASTQMAEVPAMFYNIATSSPLDASTSCVGTSSTTANCGSVTTTVANDLIYVYICRTGTPLSTSAFLKGSGYTLGTTQYQDGCASEWEVDSGTGSITPTMTLGGASTYIEYIMAFKSASAGTAPTGPYLERMTSWSSPSSTTTSYPLEFASLGNLLVLSASCGNVAPSGASDSVNGTWTLLGTTSNGNVLIGEWYVANAQPNDGSALITVTKAAGTGDCTYTFYSYMNMATSPFVNRLATQSSGALVGIPDFTSTLSAITPMMTAAPYNGVSLFTGGEALNTSIALNSGCDFDASTNGGENLDGPWLLWQNNPWGHCYFTNSPSKWQFTLTSASENTNNWAVDISSFLSSTGVGFKQMQSAQASTTATTLAVTISPTASNLLLAETGWYDGATARTVSTVKCNDGSATAFTPFSSGTAAVVTGNIPGVAVYYLLSAPSGCTTVTFTYSGNTTNREATVWEAVKASGGSWAIDGNGGNVRNVSATLQDAAGPTLTPSGTPSVCVAGIGVANAVDGIPFAGNIWVYPATFYGSPTDDATESLITTLASVTPAWDDNTSGGAYSAVAGCAK